MADTTNLLFALGLFLSLAIYNYPASVNGQNLPKSGLFTFGDGYYDVGNKQHLSAAFVSSTAWPYGKSVDNPSGRWADGRIVPDFIAEFFGIPNPVPPALEPDADLSRGVSFAVADATVLGEPVESMTLSQQVLKFKEFKGNWTDNFLSESMFLVYIGADDYLNFTKYNSIVDASSQQAFVATVVNKITTELESLYRMGARKFGYQTLAPLGCFPIVKQEYKIRDECLQRLNDLAVQHNAKIRPMLEGLAKKLPGFQYTVFDFYTAMMVRFDRPLNYRYLNVNTSCCGIGSHNAFGCGYLNVHSKLCNYPRAYLFYDGRNNAEKTNEAIAHLMFGADPSVIGPMNLRELLVFPVGMNMLET